MKPRHLLLALCCSASLAQTIQVNRENRTVAVTVTGQAEAEADLASVSIRFKAVLPDNGVSFRSHAFALKHRRTRPYTPGTNGKAERFIQTALREWAYARTYQNSAEREQHLAPWIHHYNWHRPHASRGLSPPISRAGIERNNLLSLHT